jgi:hypothetical protein
MVHVENQIATITGAQGTKVSFPKNSFVNMANQPVSGDIQIELIEIYDQASMILSDKQTVSNGQLLISGGEIFLGASLDGETLQLDDDITIRIDFPATSTNDSMTLFTGNQGASNAAQFNWVQVPNVVPSQQNPTDSSWNSQGTYVYYEPSKYIYTCSVLGWINCDRFYNVPNTTLKVTCNNIAIKDDYNLRGFIAFKNINSVSSLWENIITDPQVIENYYPVPLGEEATIVVFYLQDGKQYLGIKEVTITNNMNISLDFEEFSEEQIVNLIKQKFN